MARPKKVTEKALDDSIVTIVDDKSTDAMLPLEVAPTGQEVIEDDKPLTYDPQEDGQSKKTAPYTTATKQADTVTVCCNLYQDAIFVVRLPNGSMAEVKLNGNNKHLAGLEMGKNPSGGAFGMTFGVPSDMWELIKKQHKSDPRIINGLVFASTGDTRFTKSAIRERSELRNGNEPLDPKNVVASTTPFK